MIITSIFGKNLSGKEIVDAIDSGTAKPSGYIEFRTGPRPANPQVTAIGTTLLVTMDLAVPSFNTFVNGVATIRPTAEKIAVATGQASWFRIYNRDNQVILDGSVTGIGLGGDIQCSDPNFIAGGIVSFAGLSLRVADVS